MRISKQKLFLFLLLMSTSVLMACSAEQEPTPTEIVAVSQLAQASSDDSYEVVMSVLTSPRCMNCHPSDDRPRQTDEQIIHPFNVVRGEDDLGGPVQTCATCHQEENNEYSGVPGAPHWGLAPESMGWMGLTDAEIATVLLDPALNGGRDHEELLKHMSQDSLVLWAWEPGADRNPPPVAHADFVVALTEWFEAGAPIPTE